MPMDEAYERYYETTIYDRRYPTPNMATLRRIEYFGPPGSVLVDVGAGNGRYAIALALRGYRVIATERSSVARRQLAERVDALALSGGGAISIFPDITDVPQPLLHQSRHVLLLFGLLGHMAFAERQHLLGFIARNMPENTRIAGSVPNRLRRFRAEQRTNQLHDTGDAPRFWYERDLDGLPCRFEYTAFSPKELSHELTLNGWRSERLVPESVLPEETVTARSRLGSIDGVVSRRLPATMGYCLYFEASRACVETSAQDSRVVQTQER